MIDNRVDRPNRFSDQVYDVIQVIKTQLVNEKSYSYRIFYEIASFLECIEESSHITSQLSYKDMEVIKPRLGFDCSSFNHASLSQKALHSYFSWRTAMRAVLTYDESKNIRLETRFIEENTHDYYMVLYMYEIINLIGIENCDVGHRYLLSFQSLFENIDKVHIYGDLFYQYEEYYGYRELPKYEMEPDAKELYKGNYQTIIDLFKRKSAYNYLVSSFYSTETGYLIEIVMPFVCQAVHEYMVEKGIDFRGLIAGDFVSFPIEAFSIYPFNERNKRVIDGEFNPDFRRSYGLKDGRWMEFNYCDSEYSGAIIGYLFKITEKNLREFFRFNSRITINIDRFMPKEKQVSSSFQSFRCLLYGHECNQVINETVYKYLTNNNLFDHLE